MNNQKPERLLRRITNSVKLSDLTLPANKSALVFVLALSIMAASLPGRAYTSGAKCDVAGRDQPVANKTALSVQQARVAYGQLGVSFEENRGQADERVEFIGRDGGATVFLTNDAAWFVMSAPVERAGSETQSRDGASDESGSGENVALTEDQRSPDALVRRGRSAAADEPRRMHAVRMEIEGANTHTEVVGERELEGRLNYFRGNDPSHWQTDVKTYGAVRYRGIYEGIDLLYYGNDRGEIEYDFQVAPGADAGQISLRVEGAEGLEVDADGDLLIKTPTGDLRQRRPVVFQEAEGGRQEVASGFAVEGDGRVRFALGEYDRSRALVIDPVLVYSTYLGGSVGVADSFGIAVDSAGNAYVTGRTSSTDFPTTPGAFDTTFNGGDFDAFVTKLNPTGTALVYSTYLGGSNRDAALGIAVDAAGNAYVTGDTSSTNFPTTPGAFDSTFNGGDSDAFVTKLNPTGTALVYSTYLGSSGTDQSFFRGIAVDSAGNAYVTGETDSTDFPTTPGAFDATFNGGFDDAFATKLNPTGSALVYSTYLGGGSSDEGFGIAVDAAGNAYVTGFTSSTDFPTTPGAFDTTANGDSDVFVTKLNPTGSALVYSTYLGGSDFDGGTAIAVDAAGNAYVTGVTNSTGFPTTPGAFDTTFNGFPAFVSKFAEATPTPSSFVQFSASTATATETLNATTKLDLAVTRTGNTSGAASANYGSSDATANDRSDYLAALGTLRFQAGETTKTISVFIVDDSFGELAETFNITLSNPVGCLLGATSMVSVTINSNEAVNGPNPVRDASFSSDFFVRQHYVDFLNREADAPGLAFWKNQIDECTTQACREIQRINVSAAFFLSIEFQQTGYLVYKAYQAAFNSGEQLELRDFLPDTQEIGRGVVIGQPGADQQLETNKQNFFNDFVQRPAFLAPTAYPTTLTAAQFVDKLNGNTFDPRNPGAGALTQSERDALVAQLSPDPTSPTLRAQVLRSLSENGLFGQRQFNKAFVLMQYFGYLRRNPNATPDTNFDGYNFWLGKLNQFDGNFVNAEMVKAFIISGEYIQRFGP